MFETTTAPSPSPLWPGALTLNDVKPGVSFWRVDVVQRRVHSPDVFRSAPYPGLRGELFVSLESRYEPVSLVALGVVDYNGGWSRSTFLVFAPIAIDEFWRLETKFGRMRSALDTRKPFRLV